ncbi:MAG TPA: hypothetical protein VN281_21700 [Verrucomicrobiae bacterium]|nr:hypothetical protein [Verrucomicrobiae bacterium]
MAYLIFAVHAATPTLTLPPQGVAGVSRIRVVAPAPQIGSEGWNEQQQEIETRKTSVRLADLNRMENERHLLTQASGRTESEREILRVMRRPQWSAYYSTNWAAFQELQAKAAQSMGHKTACTICDGTGRADFCLLCGDLHGKCARCQGTGRTTFGGYCPACLGTGKCYLCGGTGMMPCDFCDDGVITPRFIPHLMMPLE